MRRTVRRLDEKALFAQTENRRLEELGFEELTVLFENEKELYEYAPLPVHAVDPRNGETVLFCPARAHRPHDNRSEDAGRCPVCAGSTTRVIDTAPLARGAWTFINKNLYPIVLPRSRPLDGDASAQPPGPARWTGPSAGLHFLQWLSTEHEAELHTMEPSDLDVIYERLAALEAFLLHRPSCSTESARLLEEVAAGGHEDGRCGDREHAGHVCIIKNYGHLVGGSLSHGHFQIALSSTAPRKAKDDRAFREREGETFCSFMWRENPPSLTLAEGEWTKAVVPFFLRRPLDVMILTSPALGAERLHHMPRGARLEFAVMSARILRAVLKAMERRGRIPTYNLVFHNEETHFYMEVLPYTQEMGGYEHLGLFVCQSEPHESAALLKECMEEDGKGERT